MDVDQSYLLHIPDHLCRFHTHFSLPSRISWYRKNQRPFCRILDVCRPIWDVNVDRWSSGMARPLFEAFVYATRCVIELFCILMLVFWNVALMYKQIFCSIGCLKDVCNIFSRYVQFTSVYCSCVAIWVPEDTKFVWS